MNRRELLRNQLRDAWKATIEQDYRRQRINSERSLQASLWSQLNSILPPKTRRMFIEPILKATVSNLDGEVAQESRYPDIVICNKKEVIGIIEIKYLPRAKPNWTKDLQTFSWIHKNRDQFVIQNIRHRGVATDSREYKLSKDVLFVWAGVHLPSKDQISQSIDQGLAKHFLPLHAITRKGEHPELK
jgi:hypothetical protein